MVDLTESNSKWQPTTSTDTPIDTHGGGGGVSDDDSLTLTEDILPYISHSTTTTSNVSSLSDMSKTFQETHQETTLSAAGRKRRVTSDKRAEQNRQAQRNFRVRKEQYVSQLEKQVLELSRNSVTVSMLEQENSQLKQMLQNLMTQQQQPVLSRHVPFADMLQSNNLPSIPLMNSSMDVLLDKNVWPSPSLTQSFLNNNDPMLPPAFGGTLDLGNYFVNSPASDEFDLDALLTPAMSDSELNDTSPIDFTSHEDTSLFTKEDPEEMIKIHVDGVDKVVSRQKFENKCEKITADVMDALCTMLKEKGHCRDRLEAEKGQCTEELIAKKQLVLSKVMGQAALEALRLHVGFKGCTK